ncbi:MAG: rane protein [Bradyrhizobium sp.]|nr:rane protein [Bradyrhizobium sp.]
MTDLVEVVSYHVDIQHNLEAFMAVKERYAVKPYPRVQSLALMR